MQTLSFVEQILDALDSYLNNDEGRFGFDDKEASYEFAEKIEKVLYDAGIGNFSLDYGASRIVIIPKFEDYVIKLPMNGFYSDDEWIPFSIADYNNLEYTIYNDILTNYPTISKVFAAAALYPRKTKVGEVLIQEKVIPLSGQCAFHKRPSRDSLALVKSGVWKELSSSMNDEWLACIYEQYGDSVETALNDYAEITLLMEDMHSDNYGYRLDGSPVIFDYCGYEA